MTPVYRERIALVCTAVALVILAWFMSKFFDIAATLGEGIRLVYGGALMTLIVFAAGLLIVLAASFIQRIRNGGRSRNG